MDMNPWYLARDFSWEIAYIHKIGINIED